MVKTGTLQTGAACTSEVIEGCQEVASNRVLELVGLQVQRQAAKERVGLLPRAGPIALLPHAASFRQLRVRVTSRLSPGLG